MQDDPVVERKFEGSPAEYVIEVLRERGFDLGKGYEIAFVRPTGQMVAAYTTETLQAVRTQSVAELRKLLQNGVLDTGTES